jgi:hypothetical protein
MNVEIRNLGPYLVGLCDHHGISLPKHTRALAEVDGASEEVCDLVIQVIKKKSKKSMYLLARDYQKRHTFDWVI